MAVEESALLPSEGARGEHVYETLLAAIVSGELRPGERLVERSLAHKLGVSRTPVREALHRLGMAGLVQTTNRETVVAVHSEEDLHDLCVAREGLEGLVARLAASGRADLDLMRLDHNLAESADAVAVGDVPRLVALNHAFHDAVWIAAGNRYLAGQLRLLRGLIERLQQTTLAVPHRQQEMLEEHRALVEALRGQDAHEAEEITRRHFRTAMALRLANLAMPPERSARPGGRTE
jgi:DNA-binding GntR family transcriptional regulator